MFKNTIDWISRSGESYRLLENKPIVLLSTSPSPGGGRNAVAHAESVLTRLAGKIVGKVSIPSFYKNISTENGFEIKNGQYQLQLNEAIIQLENELMNNDSERLQKMINALN